MSTITYNKLNMLSLTELKDKYIGTPGSPEREEYEQALFMELQKLETNRTNSSESV
ncbi:hypothetical protein [Cyclonatronum proteinivorum]|uniref:hypothetical protein n=1 Tax=Cyclonatronum proteinivorum TaxID=1457365 RepID=UPI0013E08F2C|nr:hypothetical protein [Cyclonatronum proteinivorum]